MKTICLSTKQYSLVSDEDYEKVNKYKWYGCVKKNGNVYARRKQWIRDQDRPTIVNHPRKKGEKRVVYGYYKDISIHRFIMNAPDNMEVDHINGNTLDNRRENLRLATKNQNMMNAKRRKDAKNPIKGIIYDKKNNAFRPFISINGKMRCFKRCKNIEDAIAVRKQAELEYYGNFASAR